MLYVASYLFSSSSYTAANDLTNKEPIYKVTDALCRFSSDVNSTTISPLFISSPDFVVVTSILFTSGEVVSYLKTFGIE